MESEGTQKLAVAAGMSEDDVFAEETDELKQLQALLSSVEDLAKEQVLFHIFDICMTLYFQTVLVVLNVCFVAVGRTAGLHWRR